MTYGPAGWRAPPLRGGDLVVARSQVRFQRACMLDPHERAIARSKQKIRIDQRAQQGRARVHIEAPQPPGLRFGQPQSRHLQKFPLNAPEHFFLVDRRLRRHWPAPLNEATTAREPAQRTGTRGFGATDMPPLEKPQAADLRSQRCETRDFSSCFNFCWLPQPSLAAQLL